jgi:TRAP-type uncharacterized transport system substrate-binding protein
MVSSVLRTLFGLGLLALPAFAHVQAAEVKRPGNAAAAISLGLIASDATGTETTLAAEMAELFVAGPSLRVSPKPGDGGRNNLVRLLTEPGIDVAFVSTDALLDTGSHELDSSLPGRIELVARLGPQEIHVVARQDVAELADLAGRKVNFGPAGGSSAVTAERLFKTLNIQVEPQALGPRAALAQLQRGAIDAAVVVGGKPEPLIGKIPSGLGIHLLPIPFAAAVENSYLPARFEHDDYPNLIETETSVPSLATGMVLLAARSKNDQGSAGRVAGFIETLFSRFGELERPGHHPKWREINLAATLPGLTRAAAADAWIARRPIEDSSHVAVSGSPVGTSVEASAAGATSLPMSQNQKDALFKGFVEWQRAKRH